MNSNNSYQKQERKKEKETKTSEGRRRGNTTSPTRTNSPPLYSEKVIEY